MLDILAQAAEAAHGAEVHVEPSAFGISPGGYVALAMILVILIMLWKRVPQLIAALRAGAEKQAEEIVAKAKEDATALIARHKTLAAEKIATAERNAIEEVRAKVASSAALASRELIAARHGETEDRALADRIIAGL